MAAYGNCERGVHLALEMLPLSNDITLLTNGEELTASEQVSQSGPAPRTTWSRGPLLHLGLSILLAVEGKTPWQKWQKEDRKLRDG